MPQVSDVKLPGGAILRFLGQRRCEDSASDAQKQGSAAFRCGGSSCYRLGVKILGLFGVGLMAVSRCLLGAYSRVYSIVDVVDWFGV